MLTNAAAPLRRSARVASIRSGNRINEKVERMAESNPVFQFSAEQFEQMMSNIEARVIRQVRELSSATPTNSATPVNAGNFVKCTSHFAGTEEEDVNAFIDAVETFRDCANVSDENALRGLPMLLTGAAAKWYQGVKGEVADWVEAVAALRAAYGAAKPAPLIYRELFSKEQDEHTPTDIFVSNARALFSMLQEKPSETMQLDMIHGLLHRKIRKRVLREDVNTFEELLRRARTVERALKECEVKTDKTKCARETTVPNEKVQRCGKCRARGHDAAECRAGVDRRAPPRVNGSVVKCYGCGAPGKIRSRCDTCNPPRTATTNTAAAEVTLNYLHIAMVEAEIERGNSRPLLPIGVYDRAGVAFADSGAQTSIAGRKVYDYLLSLDAEFRPCKIKIAFADGVLRDEDASTVTVPIKLAEKTVATDFIVLPKLRANRTLLGVDFLRKAGVVLDLSRHVWYFAEKPANTYNFAQDVTFANEEPPFSACAVEEPTYALRADEGATLTGNEKRRINELLHEYRDAFRSGGEPTDALEHSIDTGDHPPISVPPYRLPEFKKEFLRKEIDRLLEEGVIEECESPWSFPVVLVPKKDGDLRLCIDYRKLNAITKGDSYPLPRMEDILHSAKRAKFISTIDLQSGYWQVRVRESDRDKTCFVCPLGTYRFIRMPMGLKTAGNTFQRLMDRFRAGLGERTLAVYLDDLIVISETFEEHLSDLRAVFERLKLFKLRAKRDKCVFGSTSVRYLGHVISEEGIRTDPSKVDAILQMKPPRNVKEVMSFYQTCSWYRRFVPDFSEVARPLSGLTKKGAVWTWGPSQQHAFDTLKELLSSPPILRQADPNLPYTLRTDASCYALGAVLLQGEGTDERPIEYASRLLIPAETRYSTTEREALAVVWAVDKFRGYIEGARVTVATDHQALKWLLSLKSPTGRLARWALRLQSYDLKVTYTPGKSNVVADTLSRPPGYVAAEIGGVSVELPRTTAEDIRREQLRDPEVKKIIDAFEADDDSRIRWADRGFVMLQGALYRQDPEVETDEAQQVVPSHLREQVMREYHDAPTAGHYGVERTLNKIATRYYFTGMRRFVSDYVRKCVECQKYKADNLKPAGLLQTPVAASRFETVAIDLFGPLPKTARGNKWVFVVEDTASKWVELFAIKDATAEECAKTLIEEVITRFGTPRKLASDNGVQFISDVMQQVAYCLDINQCFIPLYHPSSNPVERKNRDLKTQLSILVGNEHDTWDNYLGAVRFAINTTQCESTGHTPAFLTFARELRTPDDVTRDLRAIVDQENFVPRITPYLRTFADVLRQARDRNNEERDRRKVHADGKRRDAEFKVGDLVLLKTHALSSKSKRFTAKFAPKRDGPYEVSGLCGPTGVELRDLQGNQLGKYHVGDLKIFATTDGAELPAAVMPKRRRGRPRKKCMLASGRGAQPAPEGEHVAGTSANF